MVKSKKGNGVKAPQGESNNGSRMSEFQLGSGTRGSVKERERAKEKGNLSKKKKKGMERGEN